MTYNAQSEALYRLTGASARNCRLETSRYG